MRELFQRPELKVQCFCLVAQVLTISSFHKGGYIYIYIYTYGIYIYREREREGERERERR